MPEPFEVVVVIEPPSPDVVVVVEPPLAGTDVVVSDVGLPGREATDAGGAVFEHINSETPHPVYDDGPSLSSFYQNQKV